MANGIFTWSPEWNPREDKKPRSLEARFGDGYSQRAGDGINVNLSVWQLVFAARSNAEADAIEAFLDAHAGYQAFYWSPPPNKPQGAYICKNYQRIPTNFNLNTINATFEMVAEP